MTDGETTRSKDIERHGNSDKADADDKTSPICKAVKDEDIIVYTIACKVTDAATKSLLQTCASGNNRHFNARNAKQLNKAFEEIAASLSELRSRAEP